MNRFTEERIRQILTLSPAVIYTCRADGDFGATFVSDNITSLFGYTVRECLENPDFWRSNIHPDDHDRVFAVYGDFFVTGYHIHEYRFRKKDGSYAWVHDELRLLRDERGRPVEIIGSWLDVTDRRTAQDALMQSDALFKAFFDSNPIPTVISSLDGIVLEVNPAFLDSAGFAKEDVVGASALELFWSNPDDRARMVSAIRECGALDNFESVFFDRHRAPRRCLLSSRAIEIAGDVKILNTLIDVTEKRAAEEALRKSEKLFKDFFEANPVPTIISSPDGTVLRINPAFTKNPGYTEKEVVGRTVQELGFWRIPEDRERMVSAIREHGSVDHLESQFYGKGQRLMTCLISSRAIEFEGEVQVISTVLDVTEQKQAEEAMRKLEQAKSDFISTVAHELRTPLIAIIGYCELLENATRMKVSEREREEYLAIIQSNADVLNRLVDDLLDIGRIQVGRSLGITRQETDLLSLAEKVAAATRLNNGHHDITIETVGDLPKSIWLDAGRITQVLHNLLSNAIKYSPGGGLVKLRLVDRHDHVDVSVVDQGIGMTAEQAAHIFDRFYRVDTESVKAAGLGLGMSIVKQIITDHGGDIVVSSTPGIGTTVTFSLPVRT